MIFVPALIVALTSALTPSVSWGQSPSTQTLSIVTGEVTADTLAGEYQTRVQPLLKSLCFQCHDGDTKESGIQVDHLDGSLPDKHLRLWEEIRHQIADSAMPPDDEKQPSAKQRQFIIDWIDRGLHFAKTRPVENNGSVRRLTVAQYRNTLRDLLGLQEDVADVLPPDAVSKDGFTNNSQSMGLSPLQVEAYFDIADKALNLCIVDEQTRPTIQNFRMDLGKSINNDPCRDHLILGANNRLLANEDFIVHQLTATKPFEFTPFVMQTKYRFHEGYQGNSTVRGWREFDSIYHAVYACVRGNRGYPKGNPYDCVADGLLLRPAIPSAEMFQVESTYGPRANFKIALRELPDHGNFKVTVKAAKYDDGLLLDRNTEPQDPAKAQSTLVSKLNKPQTLEVEAAGIYQVDVYQTPIPRRPVGDATRLDDGLLCHWPLNDEIVSEVNNRRLTGELVKGAKFTDSLFDRAVYIDGKNGSVVVPRDETMNVGDGEFTVSAWIRPRKLKQGGIVCLGKYSWVHGWYLDMPNNRGVLRIETVDPENKSNGTVASPDGAIQVNTWQHVAAVVRRGTKQTQLYVNGIQVASGTVAPRNLDNPNVNLHIGRIQDSHAFKGDIDEVRLYRRALGPDEIAALVEPGQKHVKPPKDKAKSLELQVGDRHFAGTVTQPAFLAVRLPAKPVAIIAQGGGDSVPDRIVFTKLDAADELTKRFLQFEKRSPLVGVHVGLRRDCGHTFSAVGEPQAIADTQLSEILFEGAINNFPSPDVQKENDNYLAGVREIAVRSEYTTGQDMPRLHIRSVEFEGPYYKTWPPESHRRIFIDSNLDRTSEDYAVEVIKQFATRAFRRPVKSDELSSLVEIFRERLTESGNFQASVKDALLVVLTSPQFLFLIENSATAQHESLADYELAAKLSYFLWNAAPDLQLLAHASHDTLAEAIDSEIDRMIDDPRFSQFMTEFASEWLSLDKLDVVETDRKRYPTLSRLVKQELRKEPIEYLQYLVRNNLSVRQLVKSDFIVANDVVANYYGLNAIRSNDENTGLGNGFEFSAIPHSNPNLGGVLTQAGILAGLSDGRESNPVKRGAWLARKIIAEPPADPPPNVPALEEDTSKLSLRERLQKHRNQKGCVKCHEGIDPWGVPFEQFDAGGLFTKGAVEASSTLPDKTEVRDLNALRSYLANDRIDQVAFSVLKHLASYAIGRTLTYNEIETLKQTSIQLKPDGYRMKDMVRFVVKSDLFMKK